MKAVLILLIVTGFTAAGCSSTKSERRIAYCLAAEFNQNQQENRSEVCNVVEIGEKTEFAKIVIGPWDTCRANASGIGISVQRGDVVMLLDRQAGERPADAACAFGLLYEAKEPVLSKEWMPRFIFVPTGGSLKDAIEVGHEKLGEYGLNNLKISIKENLDKPFTYDEAFLGRFGCSFGSLKNGLTSSPPTCDSLATYQIVVPYPPFE